MEIIMIHLSLADFPATLGILRVEATKCGTNVVSYLTDLGGGSCSAALGTF